MKYLTLFKQIKKRLRRYLADNIKPLSVLFLTWGVYFSVFWPRMLYFNENNDLVAGWRNIWADWAMHISQANAFAYQSILRVITNHPIYSGVHLSYPFAFNLFSGVLLRLGVNLVHAFIFPSLIISFILLLGLYTLGKLITKSAKQTLLAISLFLTSGGLGFIYYFEDLSNNFSLKTILYPPQEYTHMKDIGYYWTTTLLAHLVPQRAFLLGMTLGVFILSYLFYAYRRGFKGISLLAIFILGLVTGLLSFVHNHTLIVLFFLSFYLFIFDIPHYKHWISYAIGATITALPFFYIFKRSGT
jgi:hypothetical protein